MSSFPGKRIELCLASGAFDFEATDTFTRGDAPDTLSSATSGQQWITAIGTAGITSNTAYFSALTGGVGVAYLRCAAGGDFQVTVSTVVLNCGLIFRVQDSLNYWLFVPVPGFNQWKLYLVANGSGTLKATVSGTTAAGTVAKVRCEGSTITTYINGTVTGSPITDTTYQYAQFAGMRSVSTSARFDDFSASFVWTDVSSYVRAIPSIQRGRQHELAQMETGTADVVFANQDRRFDPTYTSSPYYPFLQPYRRLRITGTWDAGAGSVDYPLFVGHVERWPIDYDISGADSTVKVTAVDRLAVIGADRKSVV